MEVHLYHRRIWQFFHILTKACPTSRMHVTVFQQSLSKYPKAAINIHITTTVVALAPLPTSLLPGVDRRRHNHTELLPHSEHSLLESWFISNFPKQLSHTNMVHCGKRRLSPDPIETLYFIKEPKCHAWWPHHPIILQTGLKVLCSQDPWLAFMALLTDRLQMQNWDQY